MRNPAIEATARGRCQCGAVQYEVHGPLRPVVACHCSMCRRLSGHFVAATACREQCLRLVVDDGLQWYQSSSFARRAFCRECGSNLFWQRVSGPNISIMAGTLDAPTGLVLAAHIHVASAGDYYSICDDAPQYEGGDHGIDIP